MMVAVGAGGQPGGRGLPARAGRYRNPSVRPSWYRARQRSVTNAQRRAERRLWPLFGLAWRHGEHLALDQAFQRQAPTVLEVGCGTGEALAELAAARPDCNFLGVDWYRAGVAASLQRVEERELLNVRLIRGDASTMLQEALPARPTFDEVLIFFPDPWRGSTERRVFRAEVVERLSQRMRPGGALRLATDVAGYPEQARALMAGRADWRELPCSALERSRPGHYRPSTHYAREAAAEGREACDLCWLFDGADCDEVGQAAEDDRAERAQ